MDPDTLLDNLRSAVKALIVNDGGINSPTDELAVDAAIMFDNLDHWLTNGGFIPAAWAGRDPRNTVNA